ncbi:MAG: ABC transporter ATP-binding protein, partial [Corynebacterium casei]
LGLDVEKRQVFYDVLREEHGRTIVISTHHLNELSGHLDTVLMLNGMKHGSVEELIDGILELTGHPENVDRLLNRLQIKPLTRESTALGDRVIVDAIALGPDNVFDAAGEVDVRASEVNLERAVLALGEEGIA